MDTFFARFLLALWVSLGAVACDEPRDFSDLPADAEPQRMLGDAEFDAEPEPDAGTNEEDATPEWESQDAAPDMGVEPAPTPDAGADIPDTNVDLGEFDAGDPIPDAASEPEPQAPGYIEVRSIQLPAPEHPEISVEDGVQVINSLDIEHNLELSSFEVCYIDGEGETAHLTSVIANSYGRFGAQVSFDLEGRPFRREMSNEQELQLNVVNDGNEQPIELEDGACIVLSVSLNLPLNENGWAEAILPTITGVFSAEDLPVVHQDGHHTLGTHSVFEPVDLIQVQTIWDNNGEVHSYGWDSEQTGVGHFELCTPANGRGRVNNVTFSGETLPKGFTFVVDAQSELRNVQRRSVHLMNDHFIRLDEEEFSLDLSLPNGSPRDLSWGRCIRVHLSLPFVPEEDGVHLQRIQFQLGHVDSPDETPVEQYFDQGGWGPFIALLWDPVEFFEPADALFLLLQHWGYFGPGEEAYYLWRGNLQRCIEEGEDPPLDRWACAIQHLNTRLVGRVDPELDVIVEELRYRARFQRTLPDAELNLLIKFSQWGDQRPNEHEVLIETDGEWVEFVIHPAMRLSNEGSLEFQTEVFLANDGLPGRVPNTLSLPQFDFELVSVRALGSLPGMGQFEVPALIEAPSEAGQRDWASRLLGAPDSSIGWPRFYFGEPELHLVSVSQFPPQGEDNIVSIEDWDGTETTLSEMEWAVPAGTVLGCEFRFRHGTGKFRAPAEDLAFEANGVIMASFQWDENFVVFRAQDDEACLRFRAGSRVYVRVTMGRPLLSTNPGEPIQLRLVGIGAQAEDDRTHQVNLQVGTDERGRPIFLGEGDNVRSFAVEILP